MSCWASAKRAAAAARRRRSCLTSANRSSAPSFVDGGFEAARDLIVRAWGARMTADGEPARDAKTAVQEWAQARALAAPHYEEAARSGPAHAPHFVMRVELAGYEPETGEASSKRAAEQAAAQAFLDRWSGT